MISLVCRSVLFVSFFAVVACSSLLAQKSSASENGTRCVQDSLAEDAFIKIDTEQKRFFVVIPIVDEKKFIRMIKQVSTCFVGLDWQDGWSLSVFSDKKLAGYKDDPKVIQFHRDDEWSKGYLAEYDSQIGILTLRPLFNPKKIQVDFNKAK